jgi:hypothetical protein
MSNKRDPKLRLRTPICISNQDLTCFALNKYRVAGFIEMDSQRSVKRLPAFYSLCFGSAFSREKEIVRAEVTVETEEPLSLVGGGGFDDALRSGRR